MTAAAPQMTLDERIRYALRNHEPAAQFFFLLRDTLHFWDDLIDRDKPVGQEDINRAMFKALVLLPTNSFYRQHQNNLSPILVNAIANWHTANEFEAGGDQRQLQLAFVIRSDYANLLIHAAYLVGGYEWMRHTTPMIRALWTSEGYDDYLANLANERRVRESNTVQSSYEDETHEYLRHGLTVFNAAMLGETEESHVDALLELIKPPSGAVVVDMGCGVGGVSRLMGKRDPKATFFGVTNVLAQVEAISQLGGVTPIYSDYHKVPLPDGFADVVMFNESIGYGDIETLLGESFRLLKPGGCLAIKDGVSLTGRDEWSNEWKWTTFAKGRIDRLAEQAGFEVEVSAEHDYSLDRYVDFIRDSALMSSRYKAENVCKGAKLTAWFWRLRKPGV